MDFDQAQKCVELGRAALKVGDFEKALRMFTKSNRFMPSDIAKEGVRLAEAGLKDPKRAHQQAPQTSQGEARAREEPKPEASPEVKEVLAKTDYYDILGVSKAATPDELKKAYRKLAMKFHPDKNTSPGSSEAFKLITKAFGCLNDPDKRKYYEQTGTDEPQGAQGQPEFYNDDWAEHIFRNFFGNEFMFHDIQSGRVYRHHAQPRQQQRPQNNGSLWPLVQFLPLFMLFLASSLSNLNFSEPDFAFAATHRLTLEKITTKLQVPYFVEPASYNSLQPAERKDMNIRVEREYYYYLQRECRAAQDKRNNLLFKAQRSYSGQAKYYRDLASSIDMSTCERLEQLNRL